MPFTMKVPYIQNRHGPNSRRPLLLTMDRDYEKCVVRCTVEIPEKLSMDNQPPPPKACMGGDWIGLAHYVPGEALDGEPIDSGYWDLDPEGLAMKFLRLAWYAAHVELERKHAPFDGDAQKSWEKNDGA